ncbi:MAG: ClpXP protease specificity-enhancing factor SspB [Acidobacteriota bacterium]
MTTLDYSRLIESSLRGAVRDVLRDVEENGLPGEHHFLLTFRTGYPGVHLPQQLLAQYPDEMTIVLQHQYRDLLVEDEQFSVTLRFSGVEHGIAVPFGSLTRFYDPSVNFALHFRHFGEVLIDDPEEDAADAQESLNEPAEPVSEEPGKVLSFEKVRKD